MATHISPAWALRRRWRSLAVVLTLAVAAPLAGCVATSGTTQAAGAGHAASRPDESAPPGVVVTADVPYVSGGTSRQRLDVCAPAQASDSTASTASPTTTATATTTTASTTTASTTTTTTDARPAVILIHGGGWRSGDKAGQSMHDVCTWLARSGFVTFNIDYRLAPATRYSGQIADVEAALRFIRSHATVERYDIDPARVGVLGCRTLDDCPTAAAAPPVRFVDPSDPPTFIVQSEHDFVPPLAGDRLKAKLEAAGVPVTLVQKSGSAHSIALLHADVREQIVAFLHQQLG
ncbi:alpha/beta hydrolase [Gryllotalpicola ginsengisoli]|uniref:alpha/beta hydrolase n=1 Tax=Gryllotalpicola ginsengisoli TaxID=444608 RepID=UPI0003B6F1B9|nr:alpha/beta hydrolase [Gryllotalpicola ginsengisoli]